MVVTFEITKGLWITLAGLTGILGCVLALALTIPLFQRHRKRMLEQIESE